MRRRIGVIFGGRSGEHDVSLMSAESVMAALDRSRFDIVPIGISRDGRWWTGAGVWQALRDGRRDPGQPAVFIPDPTRPGLYEWGEGNQLRLIPVDMFFPVLHGPFGEDGTIQGLFEMAGMPYVGCDVGASAVGMDKSLMKAAFHAAGLPQLPYEVVPSARWRAEPDRVLQQIRARLGFPCFVKPSSLGSSVGISRADDGSSFERAMDEAAALASKIIVEQAAVGFREIEVGVLGNGDADVSVPGEIVPAADYYDYRAKYEDAQTQLIVPAALKSETVARLKELGRAAFAAIDGSGLSRVDFFVSPDEQTIYINEINTMPGFTWVSMYPRMWESTGIPYPELLETLIRLADERHDEKRRVALAQETWRPPSSGM